MRVSNVLIVILFTVFGGFDCQIHYVPAQILIPTINGTHLATNYTVNNNSHVPILPQYNQKPSSYYNYSKENSSYNITKDGHLIIGQIQPYDRLLFNQEYFKSRRWWTYREKIIEYPKDLPAGYSRHETISALRVYNKFYDGNTARATIESGGIGRQYVKIKLESRWGNGFRYTVQIFGH
ncbi:uncharacterized protein LOC108917941 [Anoplophora glabripennis]|uniref:uncharacterized protein LOC108917941 n=1 Tax=Anoplophora glabripennis TaxID=217634 RepID=UPI000873C26E|nr:uncharacterized protein LOC108917941 [Anoplophora glabripennis]